ncbi:MAG: hypothetical protein KA174_05325 [Chitinophagales bacterium]|jgi:hypothetical protein|nr:hypothetical protein [Chitinophagales bacterium]
MGTQPTIQQQREVILEWVHRFYADSVKCLNNFCAGKQQCLRDRMAKVRLLEISTLQAEGILDEQDVTNLYNRLQCLIDLKIDLTIPN